MLAGSVVFDKLYLRRFTVLTKCSVRIWVMAMAMAVGVARRAGCGRPGG